MPSDCSGHTPEHCQATGDKFSSENGRTAHEGRQNDANLHDHPAKGLSAATHPKPAGADSNDGGAGNNVKGPSDGSSQGRHPIAKGAESNKGNAGNTGGGPSSSGGKGQHPFPNHAETSHGGAGNTGGGGTGSTSRVPDAPSK